MQRKENPEFIERRQVGGLPNFSLSHDEFEVTRTGCKKDVEEFLMRQKVYRNSKWAGVYILSHKPPNSDEWKPYYVGQASRSRDSRSITGRRGRSRAVECGDRRRAVDGMSTWDRGISDCVRKQ